MSQASQILLNPASSSPSQPASTSAGKSEAVKHVDGVEPTSDKASESSFADVLDGQKDVENADQPPVENKQVVSEQAPSENDVEAALLALVGQTGNTLPAEGEQLPPTTATAQSPDASPPIETSEELGPLDELIPLTAAVDGEQSQTSAPALTPSTPVATAPANQSTSEDKSQAKVVNITASGRVAEQAVPTTQAPLAEAVVAATQVTKPLSSEQAKASANETFSLKTGTNPVGDNLNLDDLDLMPKKSMQELSLNIKTDKTPAVTMESLNTLNQVTQATTTNTSQPQTYQQVANSVSQAAVTAPVAMVKPGWGEVVVDKVMWMSSQQAKSAEIQLDPPELGSLQVRISTQQDQTTVSFTSPNAAVRDSLDQNMTRLKEMMEGQGLNLVEAEVAEQRSNREQQANDENGEHSGEQLIGEGGSSEDAGTQEKLVIASPMGLVDQYV